MLSTYFLNDFEMVPVAPIITGITAVFTFHIRWISIVSSLYFKIFFSFFFDYITISWDGNIYQYARPLFISSDYIWLIIRNSSVRSYLLIPQYGDLIIIIITITIQLPLFLSGLRPFDVCWLRRPPLCGLQGSFLPVWWQCGAISCMPSPGVRYVLSGLLLLPVLSKTENMRLFNSRLLFPLRMWPCKLTSPDSYQLHFCTRRVTYLSFWKDSRFIPTEEGRYSHCLTVIKLILSSRTYD